jgi:F-type H+-transporting ATPase subunit gamma
MSQIVTRETLLPLAQATVLADDGDMDGADADARAQNAREQDGREHGGQAAASADGGQAKSRRASVEYEPDAETVLKRLVPDYVKLSIFRALLESTASEHGARMTAMRNASQNAGELIKDLTLEMNRARQAEITQEIMEVVAGAEGLG